MNSSKKTKIIYWLLTGLVAFIFTASGMLKLFGGGAAADMAKGVGGQENLLILGVVELIIVVFWFVNRTGIVATLLAIAYIGGAMAVHFVNNQSILVPAIIQIIIWVVAAYRFPELTKRLINQK